MNLDLEALVLALEAMDQDPRAQAPVDAFETLLTETAERYRVSRQVLEKGARLKHARWKRAQSKPSSIPPKA